MTFAQVQRYPCCWSWCSPSFRFIFTYTRFLIVYAGVVILPVRFLCLLLFMIHRTRNGDAGLPRYIENLRKAAWRNNRAVLPSVRLNGPLLECAMSAGISHATHLCGRSLCSSFILFLYEMWHRLLMLSECVGPCRPI